MGALTPYKVDDVKYLVGVHIAGKEIARFEEYLRRYEPLFAMNYHLMCVECQKPCRYGREQRHNNIERWFMTCKTDSSYDANLWARAQ